MENSNPSITQHLEGFLDSARKLEEALNDEKRKNQKLAQDYLATRTVLENGVRDLRARVQERDRRIQALEKSLSDATANASAANEALAKSRAGEEKNAAELKQYRHAWHEVLARENQARGILLEFELAKRTLGEQRVHLQTLEKRVAELAAAGEAAARDAQNLRRELATAENRARTAEARAETLQRDVARMIEQCRRSETEVTEARRAIAAEIAGAVAAEKSRLQAAFGEAVEKEAELREAEQREKTHAEVARAVTEKNRELEALRRRLHDGDSARERDLERARTRLLALTEENHRLKSEIDRRADGEGEIVETLRHQLAALRLELAQAKSEHEALKKSSNKALLVEHLRNDAALERLNRSVGQLLRDGFYAEKAGHVPDGAAVITARRATAGRPAERAPSRDEEGFVAVDARGALREIEH